jgi:uncharacterized protein
MTFEEINSTTDHLLLKCISGSKAYNLSLPTSDTDIKGIFVLPQHELYGLTYTEQVSNHSNDEIYFELGRFIELLSKNNPNILELLSTPESFTLFRHPLMDLIKPEDFLSKLCFDTFAGYAKTQIKKAKGLNKKINQSFEKRKKSILEFCHLIERSSTVPLNDWLVKKGFEQQHCGLINLDHFRNAYAIFHQSQITTGESLRGIVSNPTASDVQLSSIPKGIEPFTTLYFNKDAYSIYCKEYAEYWNWVEERNEERYDNTVSHGKNYDAKNMMHTFRLLNMAEEIAVYHKVIVHRPEREFLLSIRRGEFEYEKLLDMVEKKMMTIENAYRCSDLPDKPNDKLDENLLISIREEFYNKENRYR